MRFSHYDGKQPKQEGSTGGSTTTNTDYSLEEQVVGKWVDGRNVYEKTYPLNNKIIESGFGTSKQLISALGSYVDKANTTLALPNNLCIPYVDRDTMNLTVLNSDASIDYGNSNNYITVRYIYKEV